MKFTAFIISVFISAILCERLRQLNEVERLEIAARVNSLLDGTSSPSEVADEFDHNYLRVARDAQVVQNAVQLTDIYVGKRFRKKRVFYVRLFGYRTRRGAESQEPLVRSLMELITTRKTTIYVNDLMLDRENAKNIFVPVTLRPGHVASGFRTNNAGILMIGIPFKKIDDLASIYVRPAGTLRWDPPPLRLELLNIIKTATSKQMLTKERNGRYLISPDTSQEKLRIIEKTISNGLLGLGLFSETEGIYRISIGDDEAKSLVQSDNPPLRINNYAEFRKRNKVEIHSGKIFKRDLNQAEDVDNPLHFEIQTENNGHMSFIAHDSAVSAYQSYQSADPLQQTPSSSLILKKRFVFPQSESYIDLDREDVDPGDLSGLKSLWVIQEGDSVIIKGLKRVGHFVSYVITKVGGLIRLVIALLGWFGLIPENVVEWASNVWNFNGFQRNIEVSRALVDQASVDARRLIELYKTYGPDVFKSTEDKILTLFDGVQGMLAMEGSLQETQRKVNARLQKSPMEHESRPLETLFRDWMVTSFQSDDVRTSCVNSQLPLNLREIIEDIDELWKKGEISNEDRKRLELMNYHAKNLAGGYFVKKISELIEYLKEGFLSLVRVATELSYRILGKIMILFEHFHTMLDCRIQLPGITAFLEKYVLGTSSFSFLTIMLSGGAFAFDSMYSLIFQEEAFDVYDTRSITRSLTSESALSNWVACADCRTVEQLSVERRFNILSWLKATHVATISFIFSFIKPVGDLIKDIYVPSVIPMMRTIIHMIGYPLTKPGASFNRISVDGWVFGFVPMALSCFSIDRRAEIAGRVVHTAMAVSVVGAGIKNEYGENIEQRSLTSSKIAELILQISGTLMRNLPEVQTIAMSVASKQVLILPLLTFSIDFARLQINMWRDEPFAF